MAVVVTVLIGFVILQVGTMARPHTAFPAALDRCDVTFMPLSRAIDEPIVLGMM